LRRRLVALFAAYAIALASLLTSFGTARMAAEAAALPGATVLCHNDTAETAPAQQDDGGKLCADCCIGCLTLTAALPPPPLTIIAAIGSAGRILTAPPAGIVVAPAIGKSHRSRAPPLAA
jgi:hypothetical protein